MIRDAEDRYEPLNHRFNGLMTTQLLGSSRPNRSDLEPFNRFLKGTESTEPVQVDELAVQPRF